MWNPLIVSVRSLFASQETQCFLFQAQKHAYLLRTKHPRIERFLLFVFLMTAFSSCFLVVQVRSIYDGAWLLQVR